MVSTALSVRRTHLERTRFRILGAWEMIPSTASSVTRAHAVKSNIRKFSKVRLIMRGRRSSVLDALELTKGFTTSVSWRKGAGKAASVSNEQWERRISRMWVRYIQIRRTETSEMSSQ